MADEKKIENEVKEVKEEKPKKTKEENKKLIAYKKALDEIDKKWKKKLGTKDTVAGLLPEMNADVERFSSGSVVIDNIIGGGFPRGRIIEIFGPEASGKTSIALTAVGNVQKQGGNCFFIDVEQALDPVYARKLGVNLDELGFAQPSIAEEALQLMADLIVTDQIDLIVLDSVAALMPKAQYEEEVGKQTMALLARIMSQSLPKFTKLCREHDCSVIFINQVRDNVGVMFGAKTTTPGGKALKFYASQRLDIRRVKTIKDGEDSIGTEVKVKCVNNKASVPYGEGTTVLTFAQGINRVEELLIVGQELGVIEQKGQTFYLHTDEELDQEEYPLSDDGYKIAVYQKGLRERLTDDKVIFDEVSKLVAKKLKEEIENR